MTYSLSAELSSVSSIDAAARLIGADLIRKDGDQLLIGKIVETEAYDQTDAASHSHNGPTARSAVMFGPSGRAYVYLSYGLHYCMNVVVGSEGHGAAVLLRALEPISGLEIMRTRRTKANTASLLNGPAKLTQAFGINKSFNGHDLSQPPLLIKLNKPLDPSRLCYSPRIGISKNISLPWRVCLKGSEYLSRRLA